MNLKSLEYFLEVAKDLNMTSAAKRLYISQQALSLQIQKLESHYKVELFERQPKLRLTHAGIQLAQSAISILRENEALVNRLSDISSDRTGLLRLGIPAYRAAACFPLMLSEFSQRWPNISLMLVEESSEAMLRMLNDGALDLLLGVPSQSEVRSLSDRIEFLFLLDDRSYVICSDTLLDNCFGDTSQQIKKIAARGTDLKEFSNMPFILHKPPMRLRGVADECFYAAGYRPKVYIESSNTELIVSLYPCHLGAFFCRRTRLPALTEAFPDLNAFPIRYNEELLETPVYLMWKKNGRPPAHVADFTRLMKSAWSKLSKY